MLNSAALDPRGVQLRETKDYNKYLKMGGLSGVSICV